MDERQSNPFVVERWMVVSVDSDQGFSYVNVCKTKEEAESKAKDLKSWRFTVVAIEHVKWTYDET